MRRPPRPMSPKVKQALRDYLRRPGYGRQTELSHAYGIPLSTLNQAIVRARR